MEIFYIVMTISYWESVIDYFSSKIVYVINRRVYGGLDIDRSLVFYIGNSRIFFCCNFVSIREIIFCMIVVRLIYY